MQKKSTASDNYEATMKAIGYVSRKKATQEDYDRIGFKSGLEVHQQLKTRHKLFCKCPAGIYQKPEEYDAELIRHMRPTLSELGEYDGTALMEFKTRKDIVYHLSNKTACTYDIDDTPPFRINPEALEIAIKISILSKLNIVGEIHITRKQYLDGSIPTGFQRTGIIGVEGEIELKHKKVRLIQLSLEEDSCREVSDIGHRRIFRLDRLGMPLIETVTYPDCVNPDEVKEACDYIRFLNRSTGLVRTGIGTGRQDVNVSCRGGSRVEIKGVSHTKWIPELTHNEAFRQWSLLQIRDILNKKIGNSQEWKMDRREVKTDPAKLHPIINEAFKKNHKIMAVNLPGFKGIMSHFLQPGKVFGDEIEGRLKVIACLIEPFMVHSEEPDPVISPGEFSKAAGFPHAGKDDAQIIFWGPEDDIETALETIEERCRMAFEGVPNETRKSFNDGTTVFERVLPGADRMYPDTDSAPIPLADEYIKEVAKDLPSSVISRIRQLRAWKAPEDTYTYVLSRNLFPLIERIIRDLDLDPGFVAAFIGHRYKFVEGHYKRGEDFDENIIYDMFRYLLQHEIEIELSEIILPVVYESPKMDFDSALEVINFKRVPRELIIAGIPLLAKKFDENYRKNSINNKINWIMGELRKQALGNIPLAELRERIKTSIRK